MWFWVGLVQLLVLLPVGWLLIRTRLGPNPAKAGPAVMVQLAPCSICLAGWISLPGHAMPITASDATASLLLGLQVASFLLVLYVHPFAHRHSLFSYHISVYKR